MQKQIGKVCRTAYYQLKKIAKIRKYSMSTADQLVSAMIISHIDYFSLVFLPVVFIHCKRLNMLLPASLLVLVVAIQ
jgi:hypothetical protein